MEALDRISILWHKWKYLLFEEKCRVCGRLIHPIIENMDFKLYSPPASYLVQGKHIISDLICQLCLDKIGIDKAALNIHRYFCMNKLHDLPIASGTVFAEPFQSLVHKYKYDNDVLLAKDFVYLMCFAWQMLKIVIEKNNMDGLETVLVPVPLHRKRLSNRGYNQSEILAKCLASRLNMQVESKLLRRVKNTLSQQQLNKIERAHNVADAFKCFRINAFAGKVIVLVDDVCTSGATLIECAKAVKEAGAVYVCAITAAYVI